MDSTSPLGPLISVFSTLWWILPVLAVFAVARSPWGKGKIGELIVSFVLNRSLDANEYRILNDVTLPTDDGSTQVDHIVVSPYGIFVIETKNYQGWIFGTEKQATWTQSFHKNAKFKFQNPLRQNYKHVKTVEAMTGVPAEKIHSVVVFMPGATFKKDKPPKVLYPMQLGKYIKSKKAVLLTDEQRLSAFHDIQNGRFARSMKTNRMHKKHLKEKFGKP